MDCRFLVLIDATDARSPMSLRLAAHVAQAGGSVIPLGRRAWLAVGGPRPPSVRRLGDWIVVGETAPTGITHALRSPTPQEVVDDYWGRYIALHLDETDHPCGILRDPSGALECVIWRVDDAIVLASETPDWLLAATRPSVGIDYDGVGRVLRNPLAAWDRLLLTGAESVLPGTYQALRSGRAPQVLWSPLDWARRRLDLSIKDKKAALRDAVDHAVQGLARDGTAIACEISGGLDSSLVATSLVNQGQTVGAWLNTYGADIESDERHYAAALADRLGVKVTSLRRREGGFTRAALRAISQGPRPGYNGIDFLHDQDAAAIWRRQQIKRVFTGKGGDTVLISSFDERVFADLYKARGAAALFAPSLPRIARRTGRSVWAIVAETLRGADAVHIRPGSNLLSPDLPVGDVHPWLAGDEFGPGKRDQIAGVVDGLCFSAPSFQTEVVDMVHPLLARPVVELCLQLTTTDLTLGRSDRRLARDAFADRLPPKIRDRRSKGDHTAFFGRMIANSLEVLRPLLLEGRLAKAGLIDRAGCEAALQLDDLIWRGRYGELLNLIIMEAWTSTWEDRLAALRQN